MKIALMRLKKETNELYNRSEILIEFIISCAFVHYAASERYRGNWRESESCLRAWEWGRIENAMWVTRKLLVVAVVC